MKQKKLLTMLVLLAAVVTGAWAQAAITTDLATINANYEAKDGETLTGTLASNVKISIAAPVAPATTTTVTLKDVTINGTNDEDCGWAGITCEGNATIILEGANTVKGFYEDYPGIYVPGGKTLTIQGTGSLDASSNGYGAGIGGGYKIACGNIVIEGGTIVATGGYLATGIGGGGNGACGAITIANTVTKVVATKHKLQTPRSIGSGAGGSCGTVTIGGTVYADGIAESPYTYPTYTATLADGTEDADKWTISPASAAEGETVTVTYTGTKRLIGFKAEKKASGTPLATPLTIEAVTPGTIVVDIGGTLETGMNYSVNGGTKTFITTTTSIEGLKAGDKVQFYGNGTQTQVYGGSPEVKIQGSGDGFKTKVYGNIMSLLDEEGFATKTDLPNAQYVFYKLFKENTTLIDASELLLPATTLAAQCYFGMFSGCTSLTTAPKLPATTLATQCYYSMFDGCTSLTSAYVKAAYIYESLECTSMFTGCTATGAVLHTTPDSKASWENVMGTGKTWPNWSVADDWQE